MVFNTDYYDDKYFILKNLIITIIISNLIVIKMYSYLTE